MLLRSNFSPFPQYFKYIFLIKGVYLHIHLLNLVVQFVFFSILKICYVEVRISRSISKGPFKFEITRVDCISSLRYPELKQRKIGKIIFFDIRGYFEISVFEMSRVDHVNNISLCYSGGGSVVRRCWVNFQCRGVLLIWIIVGQGPTAFAVGAGGDCLDIFSVIFHFSILSPSLWETA